MSLNMCACSICCVYVSMYVCVPHTINSYVCMCVFDVGVPVVFDWVALELIGLGFRFDYTPKIPTLSLSVYSHHLDNSLHY